MALTLISSPEKTVNGILSNVNAGRSQLPYTFFEDDLTGKKNYKVEIEIRDSTNINPLINQTFRYSPKPDGNIFIDIGALMTEYQESVEGVSVEYVLNYRAIWDGLTPPAFTVTPVIQSVYAEKQLLDQGGSNMWNYLLKTTSAPPLSVFKNPVIWVGFTRLFNVLMDAYFFARTASATADLRFYNADINKVQVGVELGNLPIDTANISVQNFAIVNPSTNYGIVKTLDALSNNLIEEVFYENRQTAGCDNLFYLGWVNSKGGFEQWMFTHTQVVERTVELGLLAESVINQDIEFVDQTKIRLPNIWSQQMILTADHLTLDQVQGLAEMKQSDYLVVYLTPDLAKQIFVVVSNGFTQTWQTDKDRFSFSIQVEFPDNFDVFKAKEY